MQSVHQMLGNNMDHPKSDLFPSESLGLCQSAVCQECWKTFSTFGSLRYHRLTSHRRKPYTKAELVPPRTIGAPLMVRCSVCGISCLPRNLTAHMKRHDNQEFVCVECGKIFKSQKDLDSHCEIHRSLQVNATGTILRYCYLRSYCVSCKRLG